MVVHHDRGDVFGAFFLRFVGIIFGGGNGPLATQKFGGWRGLRNACTTGIGDDGFHVGDGCEAVLDLLQGLQVQKVGESQMIGIEFSHSV